MNCAIRFHALGDALGPASGEAWQRLDLFETRTAHLDRLRAHVSILHPGACPHPPHVHIDEEALLVLAGEAELLVEGEGSAPPRQPLHSGQLVLYPPGSRHSIRNVGNLPLRYLMLRWFARPRVPHRWQRVRLQPWGQTAPATSMPRRVVVLHDAPSTWLARLHCHATWLQAGAGYPEHRDPHDLAIVLLEGTIEVRGRQMHAPALVFCPAGTPHDMRNPTPAVARYLVLEWSADGADEVSQGRLPVAP